jgi:uncharacterized protein (DUF2141 family)
MILIQLLLAILLPSSHDHLTLTVTIENLPSMEGEVHVGLFENDERWLEVADIGKKASVNEDRTVTVEFTDLHPGTYAISFYHDENSNSEMDYNLIGLPKEAYGFSAGAKAVFKAPYFADATFELTEDMALVLRPQ